MLTKEQIDVTLWQRLKELADNGTIPIAGGVYNGDRDLTRVAEDITVKTTSLTGSDCPKRAETYIKVFANDFTVSGNGTTSACERLSQLSQPIEEFIESIDYIFTPYEVLDFTQRMKEEPSLRQHYNEFLIRMNIYDID